MSWMGIVMLAAVSDYESDLLSHSLHTMGLRLVVVANAQEAEKLLIQEDVPHVLILDSGLFECEFDPQWRALYRCHPDLPIVVRSLIALDESPLQEGDRHWIVHPSDIRGLEYLLAEFSTPHLGEAATASAPPHASKEA